MAKTPKLSLSADPSGKQAVIMNRHAELVVVPLAHHIGQGRGPDAIINGHGRRIILRPWPTRLRPAAGPNRLT